MSEKTEIVEPEYGIDINIKEYKTIQNIQVRNITSQRVVIKYKIEHNRLVLVIEGALGKFK